MKTIITAAAVAALLAGAALPASAHGNDHRQSANHEQSHHDAHGDEQRRVVYERPAPPSHYRTYHGHRVEQVNGHWGYYAPHNGVSLFVTVPL
jgi:hypothetical protein